MMATMRYPLTARSQRMVLSVSLLLVLAFISGVAAGPACAGEGDPAPAMITTGTLFDAISDLGALARLDEPAYRTVQFSSYDRRSTHPDAPGWYSNADGFGHEPVPGFAAVLREPDEEGVGLYLICDEAGPGAIVRGWSAAMGGTLRVYLDAHSTPVYEGDAYQFLARRSKLFLDRAGLRIDYGDSLMQQDSDYWPIPFGEHLRITWEGRLEELHFYQIQVRFYQPGTAVRTFDPDHDPAEFIESVYQAVQHLLHPAPAESGVVVPLKAGIAPGERWVCPDLPAGPAAVTELRLCLESGSREQALRGTLLEVSFDGASKPQVEAPAGDFFGAGPGVHPFESLPMSVAADGTMTCRFVMPFENNLELALTNTTSEEVTVTGSVTCCNWEWNDRSLYFRARWRVDHGLDTGKKPIDMPFVVMLGNGRLVGAAVMVANPSPVPTPWGSWWGEGDEKIFVDDNPEPVAFGTGSEDYFNYSWSRPDLFDHPFCGQPINSGPGNSGYVTNYRWQVLDAIPFHCGLAFYMELWTHAHVPGISYGRLAYLYARPGVFDDHRKLLAADLIVPPIPPRAPQGIFGAAGATFYHFDELKLTLDGRSSLAYEEKCPSDGMPVRWEAEAGSTMSLTLPFAEEGKYRINVVAVHRPDGGTIRLKVDGVALKVKDLGGAEFGGRDEDAVPLRSRFVRRRLSTGFEPIELQVGDHELVIECASSGVCGFDYLWIKRG